MCSDFNCRRFLLLTQSRQNLIDNLLSLFSLLAIFIEIVDALISWGQLRHLCLVRLLFGLGQVRIDSCTVIVIR